MNTGRENSANHICGVFLRYSSKVFHLYNVDFCCCFDVIVFFIPVSTPLSCSLCAKKLGWCKSSLFLHNWIDSMQCLHHSLTWWPHLREHLFKSDPEQKHMHLYSARVSYFWNKTVEREVKRANKDRSQHLCLYSSCSSLLWFYLSLTDAEQWPSSSLRLNCLFSVNLYWTTQQNR